MRIKKLQQELDKYSIDLALIFSLDEQPNTSMEYFTGYKGIGVLAVFKASEPFLLSPEMEYEKALHTGLKVHKTEKKKRLIETLQELIGKKEFKKIGIEENKCTVMLYKRLKKGIKGKYTNLAKIFSDLRMNKDDEELKNIEIACEVTDRVFKKVYENFNFKTESELKNFMIDEITNNNCELAFPPIVASADGSSQPHYDGSKEIKKGFLLLDFGAKYKGYCADMTRMLYLGEPGKKEIEDYNLVLKTTVQCEKAAEKKEKYSQLYDLAIRNLRDKAQYFTHGLGHGLGLDIHEAPSLTTDDKVLIQNNIPFTVEPGIYFLGKYGIRIEDTVVLLNGKLEILTKSRKDLVILRK